jgi:hypothetical protein
MKRTFNLMSKIRSALRKVWLYSPMRREAKKAALDAQKMFVCPICKKRYDEWAGDIDHIQPCGSLKTYADLPGFCERLFDGKLAMTCKKCHQIKTKADRAAMRKKAA